MAGEWGGYRRSSGNGRLENEEQVEGKAGEEESEEEEQVSEEAGEAQK